MYEPPRMRKVLDWLRVHTEDWYTICGQGEYPIDEEEYGRLHDLLKQDDLLEFTLVLYTCHGYAIQEQLRRKLRQLAEEGEP